MHKVKFLIFLVVLLNLLKGLRSYVIPNANLEILTDGFRVSIPDDKDVKIVAFNINRNRPFENYLEGEFSQKLREPANKLWTFEKTGIQLHNNDLIYIWIHVQVGNTAFRRIMHPVTVGNVKNVENMENGETSAAAAGAGAGAGAGAVCEASITRASNQRQPPCSGQLLFEENFIGDALRGENWRNEVYIPVDTPTGDNEFVYYDSATVAVADGHLKITPTLLSGEPQFLDLMDRCTAVDERERSCKRDWRNRILNIVPVASGRISTRGRFSFTYGRVEIRAKLPIGDWLYPYFDGIKKVFYVIEVNGVCTPLIDIIKEAKNGVWAHESHAGKLKANDKLSLFVMVQHMDDIHVDLECAQIANADSSKSNFMACDPTSVSQGLIKKYNIHSTQAKKPGVVFVANETCAPSITEGDNLQQPCSGQLIFEENFNGNSLSDSWIKEVYLPVDTPTGDNEFVLYDDSIVKVNDGNLNIKPILWDEFKPNVQLHQPLYLAERCTLLEDRERACRRQPTNKYQNVLPAVVSGRISTRDRFSFKYGRVEIRAKLPIGDWLYPLLLLEPLKNHYGKAPYLSGQMRVAFARGNERLMHGEQPIDGHTLYGGAKLVHGAVLQEPYMPFITKDKHFGEDFHIYSLIWDNKKITVKLDGEEYGSFPGGFSDAHSSKDWKFGNFMAPLDQEFYITIGVAAGGFSAFPNVVTPTKPWKNTSPRSIYEFWSNRDRWISTWRKPNLEVDYVRVYAI